MILLALALAHASAAAMDTAPAGVPHRVFDCRTRRGRATVVTKGGALVYSFATPGKPGLVVSTSPSSGRATRRDDMYAGPQRQIRFAAGEWSYVVHSMEADATSGSSAVSGVQVRRGRKVVADLPCLRHARIEDDAITSSLPQDDEGWSAM